MKSLGWKGATNIREPAFTPWRHKFVVTIERQQVGYMEMCFRKGGRSWNSYRPPSLPEAGPHLLISGLEPARTLLSCDCQKHILGPQPPITNRLSIRKVGAKDLKASIIRVSSNSFCSDTRVSNFYLSHFGVVPSGWAPVIFFYVIGLCCFRLPKEILAPGRLLEDAISYSSSQARA